MIPEYCRVLVVLTPTQAKVQRGVNGTPSSAHEAGVEVTVGVPDDFLTGPQMVPVFGDADNVLTANGPSEAASYQLGGGSGGDTVIVDGADNTIKATVFDSTGSNPLAVVLVDTDGDPYVAGGSTGSTVDLTGINSVAPSVGNGTSDTGTLRVAVASNNTPFHTIIDTGSTTAVTGNVTVVQPTGTNLHAVIDSGTITTGGLTDTQLRATPVPVSGTVTTGGLTDTQLRATPVPVSISAGAAVIGHVITDTGSTTAVTGNVTVVQSTASSLNAAVVGTGTAGAAAGGVLTIQGVAAMTKLLVTPDSVALPANQSVNVAQINATTPLMGSGNTGTGSLRVTIATDQPQLTNKLLVTPDANSAVNVGQIGGTSTVTAGVNGLLAVGGNIASDGVDSGNPVKIGGRAVSAAPTAVAAADRVDAISDLWGRLYVREQAPTASTWTKSHLPATNVVATATQASAGSGKRNRCTGFTVTFASGTAVITAANPLSVSLIDGAAGGTTYLWRSYINLPAVAGAQVSIVRSNVLNLIGSQATAMTLEFSAAGAGSSYQSVTMEGDIIEE